jgi:hypothetical protein
MTAGESTLERKAAVPAEAEPQKPNADNLLTRTRYEACRCLPIAYANVDQRRCSP